MSGTYGATSSDAEKESSESGCFRIYQVIATVIEAILFFAYVKILLLKSRSFCKPMSGSLKESNLALLLLTMSLKAYLLVVPLALSLFLLTFACLSRVVTVDVL